MLFPERRHRVNASGLYIQQQSCCRRSAEVFARICAHANWNFTRRTSLWNRDLEFAVPETQVQRQLQKPSLLQGQYGSAAFIQSWEIFRNKIPWRICREGDVVPAEACVNPALDFTCAIRSICNLQNGIKKPPV